ncbi:hypothetical protein [Desulfoluna butyratoxydans]|uniref:Uncharacterized protein n=1 Tax=Desulfoluna butyratoxydans TaxID=231438 RepID=A0A4V6ILV3_9BACT|nr:hypothetical protein [Desulfoluna butyratoxydans]VFQ46558.1 hypothetical protein MSL71_42250 [Desulfoluna butyratoxydans]
MNQSFFFVNHRIDEVPVNSDISSTSKHGFQTLQIQSLAIALIAIILTALFFQNSFVFMFSKKFCFLDEMFIAFVGLFAFKANRIVFVNFLVLGFIGFLLVFIFNKHGSSYGCINDFIYIFKPILLFWGLYCFLNLAHSDSVDLFLEFFSLLFIISVFYGLSQFSFWFLYRVDLPMLSIKTVMGVEEFFGRNISLRRVPSIFGHPLWFGYLCSLWSVFFLWRKKYFFSLISGIGILLSFSRWALFLAYISVFIMQFESKDKTTKYVFNLCSLIFVIVVVCNWAKIYYICNVLWKGYSIYSIKMIGIQDSIDLFSKNPLGYGFGSFGTINSVGSTIYDEISINSSWLIGKRSGIEAFYFILLVQVGFLGVLIYLSPFIKYFCFCPKSRFLLLHMLCLPFIGVLYIPLYLSTLVLMISVVERTSLST